MINVMTPERKIERLEEFLELLNSLSKKNEIYNAARKTFY